MKIPISQRLLACAGFVNKGDRVADIGCDHGYLSIHLLTQGIAAHCIASDVREGPLQSAVTNAQKYGVSEKIEFYLSDGVRNIPRAFDTLVCAGMGGDTMVHILTDAPWLQDRKYRLILQCQSKTPMLRQYLSENGWAILQEQVLRDGRFLYTVMEVLWAPEEPRLTEAQTYFPPALLADRTPELAEYCRKITDGIRLELQFREDPDRQALLEELEKLEQEDAI